MVYAVNVVTPRPERPLGPLGRPTGPTPAPDRRRPDPPSRIPARAPPRRPVAVGPRRLRLGRRRGRPLPLSEAHARGWKASREI